MVEQASDAPEPASPHDRPRTKTPAVINAPPLEARWLHTGAKYLQLLPTPITVAETEYKSFSDLEDQRIEAAWNALSQERREQIVMEWGRTDGEGGEKRTRAKPSKPSDKASPRRTERGGTHTGEVSSDSEAFGSDPEGDQPKKDKHYRAIIERTYDNPEKLDVVEGVAVSQVSGSEQRRRIAYQCEGRPL